MLDTPCSEVGWRVLATHSIRQFTLHFPSRASPCAIIFQLDSNCSDTFGAYLPTHRSSWLNVSWFFSIAAWNSTTVPRFGYDRFMLHAFCRCFLYNYRMYGAQVAIGQWFSKTWPRSGTGPWRQLYRAARDSPGIDNYFKCNFIFVNKPHRTHKCTNTLYDYAVINY